MTDGELVRRAQEGDAAALSELVRSWSTRVLIFCLAQCHNQHLAEDLAQETLLRAMRKLCTLEDPDRFGAWIRGIALRAFLDWKKARQSSQVAFSTLDSEAAIDELLSHEAESTVDQADDLDWLLREVAMLDADQRETLMLYYSHDMTYAELARLLDVSPATINLRLTRARATLRSRVIESDQSCRQPTVEMAPTQNTDPAAPACVPPVSRVATLTRDANSTEPQPMNRRQS